MPNNYVPDWTERFPEPPQSDEEEKDEDTIGCDKYHAKKDDELTDN